MAGQGRRHGQSGDILAEIETDKATMEFEAVDEGTIAKILVAEGTDGVKVGAPIAILAGEGEDVARAAAAAPAERPRPKPRRSRSPTRLRSPHRRPKAPVETPAARRAQLPRQRAEGDRVKAARSRAGSPKRRASISRPQGTGPGGRIVRADLERRRQAPAAAPPRRRPQRRSAAPARDRRADDPARGGQALATCARRSPAA